MGPPGPSPICLEFACSLQQPLPVFIYSNKFPQVKTEEQRNVKVLSLSWLQFIAAFLLHQHLILARLEVRTFGSGCVCSSSSALRFSQKTTQSADSVYATRSTGLPCALKPTRRHVSNTAFK
ncbi:hypothetical protein WN943_017461 [Citrus x changshan-huyou]